MNTFKKEDTKEQIVPGDLISITENGTVKRSYQNHNKKPDTRIIGVCVRVNSDEVDVENSGIVDINIEGMSGLGDMITASEIPGKGRVLKYIQEQRQFNIRSIGKVIGLYNNRKKVKILLNIE